MPERLATPKGFKPFEMYHELCKCYGQNPYEAKWIFKEVDFWKMLSVENRNTEIQNYLIESKKK